MTEPFPSRVAGPSRVPFLLLVGLPLVAFGSPDTAQEPASPLPEPEFSVTRGHYDEPFRLVITSVPGASLQVTTDGSLPSEGEGRAQLVAVAYEETATVELLVDRTMSVRAIAVAPGVERSKVATHSYVIVDQVLRQGAPVGSFEPWGHSGADWEMDPDVVNHPDPDSRVVSSDLIAVPALYLSVPFEDMWGRNGIYIEGEGEPRETSVELLNPSGDPDDPNGLEGLQVDGTVEITGGGSTSRWKTDKLSMRLRFDDDVEFPVFEHGMSTGGSAPTQRFRTLILDARLNESWVHPRAEQQIFGRHTRDQFVADVQNAVGGLAPHGRHVHLYVGGCIGASTHSTRGPITTSPSPTEEGSRGITR